MTEHIINFAIGIDDDAIIKTVQEKAVRSITQDIKVDVLNRLFEGQYYEKAVTKSYGGELKLDNHARLTEFATDIVKEAMEQYKDDIIDKAAAILADSYRRTKAWKEKAGEVT